MTESVPPGLRSAAPISRKPATPPSASPARRRRRPLHGRGIWRVASNCTALVVGGSAAARLAGVAIRFDGLPHGLVARGSATLLTVHLLTSAMGGIFGGGFSALGNSSSLLGSGIVRRA